MTDDTDDESETDERSMSRRSVLSGAGLVAGGWLANKLTGGAVSVSKAQQSQEYRIEIAPDDVTEWAIDDELQGDGTVDLIIKHVPSDTTVRWDRSAGEWDFSQVSSFVVNALTADSATVTNELDAGSVSTDGLSSNIEDPNDVSSSRTLGTEYQNTTGRILVVEVVLFNDTNESATIDAILNVGNTSGSLEDVERYKQSSVPDDTRVTVSTVVPDGSYYRLSSFGQESIFSWSERAYR